MSLDHPKQKVCFHMHALYSPVSGKDALFRINKESMKKIAQIGA
jgi:hypothetical protein